MNHETYVPLSDVYLPWILDPVLIGSLVTAAVVYLLLAGPLRDRIAGSEKVKPWQMTVFMSALVLTYLTEGSPLHEMSDRYLFSAHMLQHILISYAVAPLIIWGTPAWMMRPFVLNRFVKPVFVALTRPVVAFFVFSLGFSVWHIEFVYEAALTNPFVHHSQHVIFLVLSLIMWWPLMSPLREVPRLNYGMSIIYLVLLPVGQFFAGALVTFTQVSIYPTYASAPRLFGMDVMEDQTLGGVIMKVGSFLVYGVPLIVIFLRWFNSESPSTRLAQRGAGTRTATTAQVPARPAQQPVLEAGTPADTSGS